MKVKLGSLISIILVTFCVLVSLSYAIDENSIVGIWLFDEGKGDTATDSSGNGNNGTIYDATWVDEGKFNSALSFDRGDFVEVPHSESLSITKEITVMAWVNCTDVSENPTVVGKGSGPTIPFEMSLQPGVGIFWQFLFDDGTWTECVMKPPLPAMGEWHHITGTFGGGTFKVYLDGELGVELRSSREELPENELSVTIGKRINPEGRFFMGMIDEVVIFNVALEGDDIKAIMIEGLEASGFGAVSPGDKLATTWSDIKTQ